MKTNLDKWNDIESKIKQISDEFIEYYFKDKIKYPFIYKVYSYSTIDELEITGYKISNPSHPYYYGTTPTRKKIIELQTYLETFTPSEEDIRVDYKYESGRSSYKLSQIKEDRHLSFIREDLIPYQNELKEKYEPRDGYIPCAYCGIQFPEKDAVEYTVIARQYTNMRKTSNYCSEQCGFNDQCAHEG